MISRLKKLLFRALTIASTIHGKSKVFSFGEGFTVNYLSFFTKNTTVGKYCHFNGIKVTGSGNLKIGNYFHSGEGILIITQNHNYKDTTLLPYDYDDKLKNVTIGDYVWIGSRAIILPGSELGDGCIVQAGAVVSGTFAANMIIGGNPAKVFSSRDPELVARLVAERKFLL